MPNAIDVKFFKLLEYILQQRKVRIINRFSLKPCRAINIYCDSQLTFSEVISMFLIILEY